MSREGVTIAIPDWNHELLLARSIASALTALDCLRADGGGGEVVVVDDGSRDGSLTLLRQFEANHFQDGLRVLALRKNAGLGMARNRALTHSRHRHIIF